MAYLRKVPYQRRGGKGRRFVELEKSARRARAEGGKLKDPKSIMSSSIRGY
ncbi:MAG: hypothetical protein ACLUKN_15495 [Bacilli bacterium]